jgi:uncharacterized protein DUF6065
MFSPPVVTFFRLIPGCSPPQRADRAAGGTLPTRAFRYCDPITTASAFGWYVFPPMGFSLLFDGTETMWTYEGAAGWLPLGSAQFPDFARQFDQDAPQGIKGFSPPFLSAFMEPGLIQIWSGYIARTAPGWSLLVRPAANFAISQSYDLYEGMIETDHWFGPLFINARLKRTQVPIEFKPGLPLLQVQPILRATYDEALLNDFRLVENLQDWTQAEWDSYETTVVAPNVSQNRRQGRHAVRLRRRRKQPGNE